MANIALDAGKVVLKNGNASCSCCGGVICPEVTDNYIVISGAMYNALQAGGFYVANASLHEENTLTPSGPPCDMSKQENGIIPSGNCGINITVSEITCPENIPFGHDSAYINFHYFISNVNGEYRFGYGGTGPGGGPGGSGGRCPYFGPIFGTEQCYSVGYFIGWAYDNSPGILCQIPGGGITLNTSAGTLGPFGIYAFCGFPASGSLDITITPFS